MCYFKHVCCLCLTNSNEMTHFLSEAGETIMTYYEKLTASLPQLVFNKNYDDYMLCAECCKSINSVYEFSNRCIKNLNTFLDNKRELSSLNSVSCATLRTEDVEEATHYKKCMEQDKSARQGIEVMVCKNITENEILHSIHNVKEEVDEDIVCTQNFGRLESNNEVGMQMKLIQQGLETKTLITRHDQVADVLEDISGSVQGGTEIKMEEDEKAECLDYEFITCEDVPGFCQLTEDDTRVHSQLSEKNSSTNTGEKNTTIYEFNHSCEQQRADVINEPPMNDETSLNVTSPANHSRARSDTCSSGVDVLRIHKHSTSEEEGSKQSTSIIAHSLPRHSYVCDVYDKKFKNSCNLVSHKLVHTDQTPHVCDICKKGFSVPSALVIHKRNHTGLKPYVCDVCKKGFSVSSTLVTHKRIHTGLKPYVCDVCKKGFSLSSTLVTHKRIHTGLKPYVCDFCKKGFSNSSHLVRHKRTHTGQTPYVCDICKKGFRDSSALVTHTRIHTGLKPFVCDICKKGFSVSSALVTHKRIHTGLKPYVCDICTKEFSDSSGLAKHKRIHTGLKPYVCDVCKKGFSDSSGLAKHKRIHTGLKPYVCDICKKGFSASHTLVTHKRIHTGLKPYVCDFCKKGFSNSSHLVRHKRTHTGKTQGGQI